MVSNKITVLVVDDDSNFADLTATFLAREREEFDVETATSATEGLDRLDGGDIDSIVSDYDMPDMNGLEFLTTVREADPKIPFILFTGKGSKEIASEAISAGVTDYLQKKPGSEQFELLANQIDNAVERAQAEQELERSEDLLEKTQRMASVGGWEYDLRTDEVQWTDEVNQIHELPPEFDPDLQGVLELYHPADAPEFEDAIERAVEHGESYDIELRVNTENDDLRWVRSLGEAYQDVGETVLLRGTVQDITDRKVHEREIEEQQVKMKALHAVATDLQSCRTRDEVYELAVDVAEDILDLYMCYVGIVENEAIVPKARSTHAGLEYVQTMATDEGIAAKTLQTRTSSVIADVTAAEEAKPAREDYRSAISVPLGDFGVFQAISKEVGGFDETDLELAETFLANVVATLERVEHEEQLREREAQVKHERDRFRALFEHIPDPVAIAEIQDGVPILQQVNPAFEEVFGYTAETTVGASLDDLIAPPEREAEEKRLNRRLSRNEQVVVEVRRQTATGELRDFLFRNIPIDHDTKEISFGIYTDITEQKRCERS